jgi:hypothetical protein
MIKGKEAMECAEKALAAMRAGDLKGIAREMTGPDFVVHFGDLQKNALFDLRKNPEMLRFPALAHYAGGERSVLGLVIMSKMEDLVDSNKEIAADARADFHQLLALMYLRWQIFPVAQYHAEQALKSDPSRAGARILISVLEDLAGAPYKVTLISELRWQDKLLETGELWESKQQKIQPLVITFRDFSYHRWTGAITVEADQGENPPQYRLVYRDQFMPPMTLVECGKTIPRKTDLMAFAGRFHIQPDHPLWRRAQIEARYFYRAGLAPLAAEWTRMAGFAGDESFLRDEVEQPLQDKLALFWEVRGRYNAGPDRKAPYEVTGYVNTMLNKIPDPKNIAKWMDADPRVMIKELNELRAKEMDKFKPVHPDELPQLIKFQRSLAGPLEHIHFAVGQGVERNYVGSYRLVSERFAKGERIYFVQRVQGNKVSILETLLEPPSYDQMRDIVLAWIDGAERIPAKATRLVTFDELDTAKGHVWGNTLDAHFARSGVTFLADEEGWVDVVKIHEDFGEGWRDRNFLRFGAIGAEPAMFTLRLSQPAQRVWFRRALIGFHAPWRATALDAGGRVLDTVCEGSNDRFGPTYRYPSRNVFTEFCLRGPEIVAVRFEVQPLSQQMTAQFDNLKFEFNGSP